MTRRVFCKVLLVVVAIFGLLVLSGVLSAQGRSEDAFERVKNVQEKHTDILMARPGVVGTAVGLNDDGEYAVLVLLERPGVAGIPQELEGVPVRVVVTGEIIALTVPIGVSTGNEGQCSAGTIGCRVTDGINVYALSNNHVYALENEALPDSEILQPGLYDTGCVYNEDNVIGTLADFEPIVFTRRARNKIDAAIASTTTSLVGNATPAGGYGTPNSNIVGAYLGQEVQKFGRTTGLTTGGVTGVNATVNVGYGPGKTAKFVKQIIIEPGGFSAGGDSGSLIVTDDDNVNPVGLLFAGSSTMTVANRIDLVLSRFGVTVDGEAAGGGSGGGGDGDGGTLSVNNITTDKASYVNREKAKITVTVTDGTNPVSGTAVHVQITTANGRQLAADGNTNSEGVAEFQYKVNSKRDGVGTYTVDATASKAGFDSGSFSTTFEVTK